jgi:ABC-2 type transport system permease protein
MAAERPPGTLRRLARRWGLAARLDLIWMLRDRQQFLSYTLSEGVLNVAAVTAMLLLAERFHGIGRWSRPQLLFLLGYAMTVSGILETGFNFNVVAISRRVGRGQLDHLLVQPQPLWMALLTEGFVPFSGAITLLPGTALLLWAAPRAPLPTPPGGLGWLPANLAASAGVVLAFSYLCATPAFWAPRAAEEISQSALRLMEQLRPFPLDGIGRGLRGGLVTVLPVGLAAWYPCRALLGIDPHPWSIAATPLAALLFGAAAAWSFRQGLKQYARTGSQRYLSVGHRR